MHRCRKKYKEFFFHCFGLLIGTIVQALVGKHPQVRVQSLDHNLYLGLIAPDACDADASDCTYGLCAHKKTNKKT